MAYLSNCIENFVYFLCDLSNDIHANEIELIAIESGLIFVFISKYSKIPASS